MVRWRVCGCGGSVITFVKSLEVVELRGETALAGGVDDEDDFALEVGERVDGSLVVFGLEVEESGG